MKYLGSFSRDGNFVPDVTRGCVTTTKKTLTGNNTTVAVPLFTIAGSVEILGLWGVVTTVLGANNTAAYFRGNDATNTPAITVATGTTLSAAGVGAIIAKKGLAAAALTLINSDQFRISEPTTLETTFFSPFEMTGLNGVTSNIEFVYTTTDAPTSGAIQFFVRWVPLSEGANVTAL
jgi:hypothetical protein